MRADNLCKLSTHPLRREEGKGRLDYLDCAALISSQLLCHLSRTTTLGGYFYHYIEKGNDAQKVK